MFRHHIGNSTPNGVFQFFKWHHIHRRFHRLDAKIFVQRTQQWHRRRSDDEMKKEKKNREINRVDKVIHFHAKAEPRRIECKTSCAMPMLLLCAFYSNVIRSTWCRNAVAIRSCTRTRKEMTLSGFIVVRASAFDYCRSLLQRSLLATRRSHIDTPSRAKAFFRVTSNIIINCAATTTSYRTPPNKFVCRLHRIGVRQWHFIATELTLASQI